MSPRLAPLIQYDKDILCVISLYFLQPTQTDHAGDYVPPALSGITIFNYKVFFLK